MEESVNEVVILDERVFIVLEVIDEHFDHS